MIASANRLIYRELQYGAFSLAECTVSQAETGHIAKQNRVFHGMIWNIRKIKETAAAFSCISASKGRLWIFRSCFDFINCRIEMDFRGIFVRLLRSIAGYVTKQTGEYNRKDTQDGRYKRQVL